MKIVQLHPDQISKLGLFCLKNPKNPGFSAKSEWYKSQYQLGLHMYMALNDLGETMGFIESVPIEHAWRPVKGENMLFIQCLMIYPKKNKGIGVASSLIQTCEEHAKENGLNGVAVLTSSGTWITGKDIYIKSGYEEVSKKGRFELMVKKFQSNAEMPIINDWTSRLGELKGWHIYYADQCPYHQKSAIDMDFIAVENNIHINIHHIKTAKSAQLAPTGFGTFGLIHEGKLLADHYISGTRFKNILKKENAII